MKLLKSHLLVCAPRWLHERAICFLHLSKLIVSLHLFMVGVLALVNVCMVLLMTTDVKCAWGMRMVPLLLDSLIFIRMHRSKLGSGPRPTEEGRLSVLEGVVLDQFSIFMVAVIITNRMILRRVHLLMWKVEPGGTSGQ